MIKSPNHGQTCYVKSPAYARPPPHRGLTLIGTQALTLKGYPGTANTHALSTLCRGNLKRVLITLKTHQMFSVHTLLEKFENATITGHFGFVFEEILRSSFWKSSILKMFSFRIKTQSWQCSCLKSAHFRGELVWTEDLTVEIKLHFQISVA